MEVLAVQVVVDATVDVLNRRQGNIPREIDARARFAAGCAVQVVLAGAECDLFLKAYEAGPLDPLLTATDVSYLTNAEYLISLANPVFYDSGRLAGGALRKLYGRSLSTLEPRAATIKRSTGLLAVSRIIGESYEAAWTSLGKPYIAEDLLVIQDTKLPEVTLSDTAQDVVASHSLRGRGCPAAFLKSPNRQASMLTDSWEKLVDYYLRPEWTVAGVNA